MNGSHEVKEVFSGKFGFEPVSEFGLPASLSVKFDTIPIERADFPVRELVGRGFRFAIGADALVPVVEVEGQLSQWWPLFDFNRVKQSVL
ncbi:MAG: hypothetical protein ABSH48_16155 [Verrucomicrobiota bacterium]|jgi:hypothetical protein